MENKDNILEKIQKLLALAANPGTPEEAANAMARANDLLLKYNLSMEDVTKHIPSTKGIDIVRGDFNSLQGKSDGNYARQLLGSLAFFNFTKMIIIEMQRKEYDQGDYELFGKRYNIDTVLYMFDYCHNNINVLEKAEWKNYDGYEKRNTFRRGFFRGAVQAITHRLAEQRANDTRQAQREAEQMGRVDNLGLMIVNINKDIALKVEEKYPKGSLKAGPAKKTLMSQDGMQSGIEAGRRMNLAKGVGGDSNRNSGLLM